MCLTKTDKIFSVKQILLEFVDREYGRQFDQRHGRHADQQNSMADMLIIEDSEYDRHAEQQKMVSMGNMLINKGQ